MGSERSAILQTWALAGHVSVLLCTLEFIFGGASLLDYSQDHDECGASEIPGVQIKGGTCSCCRTLSPADHPLPLFC